MAHNFFRSQCIQECDFFYEGPAAPPPNIDPNASRSGIDTATIDPFRQGVEITQQKHFDLGGVKIHAGEPGHQLRQTLFGMDHTSLEKKTWFKDNEKFNPRTFIGMQESKSYTTDDLFTFPIVTDSDSDVDSRNYDGVIEPLTIRGIVEFDSLCVPFEAHDVHGDMMGGNTDTSRASNQILQVDYYSTQTNPVAYLDREFFIWDKVKMTPFIDEMKPEIKEKVSSGTWDDDFTFAIMKMTGSTDTYVSSKQKSSSAGWDHENSLGTDSIAFGGWTY